MLEYLAQVISLAAALAGIFGDTRDKQERLTRIGRLAIGFAVLGFAVSLTLQIKHDVAEARLEKQRREFRGTGLISLQDALNEYLTVWRDRHEDGFDPAFYGNSAFDLPAFLDDETYRDTVDAWVPDLKELRPVVQKLNTRLIEILALHKDVLPTNVIIATSEYRQEPFANYVLTFSDENPNSHLHFSELRAELHGDPLYELIAFSELLRTEYQKLQLPESFEKEHSSSRIKDDLQ